MASRRRRKASPSHADLVSLLDRAAALADASYTLGAKNILAESFNAYKLFPAFHRVLSIILTFLYRTLDDDDDPQFKEDVMVEILTSACCATELSRSNIEFSLHYIKILIDRKWFEEAIKECERALAIKDPVDFILENYSEVNSTDFDVVSYIQEEIRFLLKALKNPVLCPNCRYTLSNRLCVFRVRNYLQWITRSKWTYRFWVDIEKIRPHYEVIDESTKFAHENRTWKYWVCPCCSEQPSGDFEAELQHLLKDHSIRSPLFEQWKSLLPEKVNQYWVDKLVNGCWAPIDVDAFTTANQELPLSNNVDRKKLLKAIHDHFGLLNRSNCLK